MRRRRQLHLDQLRTGRAARQQADPGAMEQLGRVPDHSEFIESYAFVCCAVFAYYRGGKRSETSAKSDPGKQAAT